MPSMTSAIPSGFLLQWCFPGGSLWVLVDETFVLLMVERFHRQICAIQRFGAGR